jgi:hypothetical protein
MNKNNQLMREGIEDTSNGLDSDQLRTFNDLYDASGAADVAHVTGQVDKMLDIYDTEIKPLQEEPFCYMPTGNTGYHIDLKHTYLLIFEDADIKAHVPAECQPNENGTNYLLLRTQLTNDNDGFTANFEVTGWMSAWTMGEENASYGIVSETDTNEVQMGQASNFAFLLDQANRTYYFADANSKAMYDFQRDLYIVRDDFTCAKLKKTFVDRWTCQGSHAHCKHSRRLSNAPKSTYGSAFGNSSNLSSGGPVKCGRGYLCPPFTSCCTGDYSACHDYKCIGTCWGLQLGHGACHGHDYKPAVPNFYVNNNLFKDCKSWQNTVTVR